MYRNILNSLKALYPTGRAFWFSKGSVSDLIHESISESFEAVLNDADSILDSFFPDSENFTEEDATLWENRLGLADNSQLPLEERKMIILRKMRHPDNTPYRQTRSFLEEQLQLSGFDVYVYENPPPYQTPEEFSNTPIGQLQVSDDTEVGDLTLVGGFPFPVVANNALIDDYYSGGGKLWPTFFIGSQNPGDSAQVDINRRVEFRELILKTKPAHLAAYILVDFI